MGCEKYSSCINHSNCYRCIDYDLYIDRSNHFRTIFARKDLTVDEVAKRMKLGKNSLYKKIHGTRKFSEGNCRKILEILDMKFEEVFK